MEKIEESKISKTLNFPFFPFERNLQDIGSSKNLTTILHSKGIINIYGKVIHIDGTHINSLSLWQSPQCIWIQGIIRRREKSRDR